MNSPTLFEQAARGTRAAPVRDSGWKRPKKHAADPDSNAMRWVFAATVMFWVVVYAAGRSFF